MIAGMGSDEPPAFTLEAVMIALDEDDARGWLEVWRCASRQLRTLMESDIAVAAIASDRNDPERRHARRLFLEIVERTET
jgi:hypothetical protein